MSDKLHLDDAELRSLLHLLSHDLRNPLAAIVTNLEFARRLVTRLDVDPDLTESIEDSVTACEVLRQIVSNFDVLVRGREVTVTLTELSLKREVEEVVKHCDARAQQASMTLQLDAPTAAMALIDKTLFALALENLIANSIQHAPRGSVIRISISETPGEVRVAVHDDGAPIAPELRARAIGIEGHTNKGRDEGTRYGRGLGLLAAHAAAAASGATLEVGQHDAGSELALRIERADTT
jgi:two-component system heavy metal sensor histidine kinase CusS